MDKYCVECVLTTSRVVVCIVVCHHRCVTCAIHGGICVSSSRGFWGALVCIVAPRLLSTKKEMKSDDKVVIQGSDGNICTKSKFICKILMLLSLCSNKVGLDWGLIFLLFISQPQNEPRLCIIFFQFCSFIVINTRLKTGGHMKTAFQLLWS